MGKHFALTLQLPFYRSEQEKKKHPHTSSIKVQHIGFAVFTLSVFMVLAYLVQVNSFSTKGYEIGSIQNDISKLQSNYQGLEVQVAQLQSIQHIQSDPQIAAMVPVTSISYVQQSAILTQR